MDSRTIKFLETVKLLSEDKDLRRRFIDFLNRPSAELEAELHADSETVVNLKRACKMIEAWR